MGVEPTTVSAGNLCLSWVLTRLARSGRLQRGMWMVALSSKWSEPRIRTVCTSLAELLEVRMWSIPMSGGTALSAGKEGARPAPDYSAASRKSVRRSRAKRLHVDGALKSQATITAPSPLSAAISLMVPGSSAIFFGANRSVAARGLPGAQPRRQRRRPPVVHGWRR
jgi:hypothetical protein